MCGLWQHVFTEHSTLYCFTESTCHRSWVQHSHHLESVIHIYRCIKQLIKHFKSLCILCDHFNFSWNLRTCTFINLLNIRIFEGLFHSTHTSPLQVWADYFKVGEPWGGCVNWLPMLGWLSAQFLFMWPGWKQARQSRCRRQCAKVECSWERHTLHALIGGWLGRGLLISVWLFWERARSSRLISVFMQLSSFCGGDGVLALTLSDGATGGPLAAISFSIGDWVWAVAFLTATLRLDLTTNCSFCSVWYLSRCSCTSLAVHLSGAFKRKMGWQSWVRAVFDKHHGCPPGMGFPSSAQAYSKPPLQHPQPYLNGPSTRLDFLPQQVLCRRNQLKAWRKIWPRWNAVSGYQISLWGSQRVLGKCYCEVLFWQCLWPYPAALKGFHDDAPTLVCLFSASKCPLDPPIHAHWTYLFHLLGKQGALLLQTAWLV